MLRQGLCPRLRRPFGVGLVCSDIEMGSQSVDDFWVNWARNNDGRFHEFQWVKLNGGFKFEAQRVLVIDEIPLRVF